MNLPRSSRPLFIVGSRRPATVKAAAPSTRPGALAVVLIVALVLTVLGAGTAGAQEDVNDWVAVTGVERLPSPDYYTDFSGAALNPDGTLVVVDNGEDDLIEYLPDGQGGWNLGRIIDLNVNIDGDPLSDPVDDVEDITRMGNGRYAIIDEYDNTLTVFDLAPGATAIEEVYTVAVWPFVDNFGGNGIEGLFYSFEDSVGDTDTFYVASEVNALIVRLDIVNGTVTERGPDIRLNIPAASAVHRVPNDGMFYVVANRSRSIYRFDSDGVQLGPGRALSGFGNPEGLTFSADGQRMLVIGEARGSGNQIQEFQPPAQPASTLLVRLNSPANDGNQLDNGSVTVSGDRLELAAGPFRSSGIHIESLCVPAGAQIRRASLSFVPAQSTFSTGELRVVADRSAASAPIDTTRNNLSNRPSTVTVAENQVGSWNSGRPWRVFAADLTGVLDEIRSVPGRGECGPVTLRISTLANDRFARSADAGSELAPTLVIEWVPAPAQPQLGLAVATSCLGGNGRVDLTVINPSASAKTVQVGFTDLPERTLTLGAGDSAPLVWTGRADGRYLISTSIDGAPTGSEVAVVDCAGIVTVTQRCLAGNGYIGVDVLNDLMTSYRYVVSVGALSPRNLDLYSWEQRRLGVSGRADGDYQLVVARENEVIFVETLTVDCDPDLPPIPSVATSVTCLGGNGLVEVRLHNDGGTTAEFAVTIGALAPRVRTLAPSQVTAVRVSGRRDGLLPVAVTKDSVGIFVSGVVVDCDPPGSNELPQPTEPVVYTVSCLSGNGRIDINLYNSNDTGQLFRVTIGGLPPREAFIGAGGRAVITATGRPNGRIGVFVEKETVIIDGAVLDVVCD